MPATKSNTPSYMAAGSGLLTVALLVPSIWLSLTSPALGQMPYAQAMISLVAVTVVFASAIWLFLRPGKRAAAGGVALGQLALVLTATYAAVTVDAQDSDPSAAVSALGPLLAVSVLGLFFAYQVYAANRAPEGKTAAQSTKKPSVIDQALRPVVYAVVAAGSFAVGAWASGQVIYWYLLPLMEGVEMAHDGENIGAGLLTLLGAVVAGAIISVIATRAYADYSKRH